MNRSTIRNFLLLLLCFFALSTAPGFAQQTLGWIDGTVTDSSGAFLQGVAIKVRNVSTNLIVTAQTKPDGSFHVADLPIGTYELTFTRDGFKTAVYSSIVVQGNRTTTVNARLQLGGVSTQITVSTTPLLNQTDTTTGYILGEHQIQNIPLGTGSFTQLAILSPGVNADMLNSTGTNSGLGNQAIWANGQRDTSNSFSLNGVSANNIFNGKSTSQVSSSRVAVNIGETDDYNTGTIITSTSVYGAIGQALPSPPPETIQELQVNSAMYDASQGSNSGAHIETSTKSGTNDFHGGLYEYYQTGGWNATPFFYSQEGLPGPPALHRNTFGGLLGGPIKKSKLFFFASYQGQRVSDQLLGTSLVAVPPHLTDDRSAAGLATVVNTDFGPSCGSTGDQTCTAANMNPVALNIMNAKNKNGTYLIPSAATGATLTNLENLGGEAEIVGPPAHFSADQVNGNIDYVFGPSDRLAAKYYFQNDPNSNPFANAEVLSFPATMHAGSQVFSLSNSKILTPNLSWEQRFGFVRERAFTNTSQEYNPSDAGITLPGGLTKFPEINIGVADNYDLYDELDIGPKTNFANAGVFQNDFEWSTGLSWVHGRHTVSTGFQWDYLQLNVANLNNEVARLSFADFPGFMQGNLCSPAFSCGSVASISEVLSGATSRHYRANEAGAYVQDDFRLKSNLTLDLGLRWDWDGPLSEANGLLANFYPQDYSYDVASDTINNIGLVIAGNNKAFGTKGVSNSTLTGRQWGFAPRIGVVYSPGFLKNLVIRAGFGMYYDRGEFFSELSPSAGGGVSGPFGVTVEEPFVVPFYPSDTATFAVPFGTAAPPAPPNNFSSIEALIPNAALLQERTTAFCESIGQSYCGPLDFGGYDPKNKLPYSQNWTLDLQWQPVNDLVFTLGYVGNHGVHGLIPLPFNQAVIATAQNPVLAGGPNEQIYSYGFNVKGLPSEDVKTLVSGYTTGNAALRAPYLGYDPNSDFNEAVGTSSYNALQFQVNKRFRHGLMVTGSYTWSHTLDDQSGLGLFFNGNDPSNPGSAYGTSDYDRTHVLTINYLYQFPTAGSLKGWQSQIVNGWGINGITVLQSGQPYSVIDYTGGVASIFWGGGNDEITNPIVPVGGLGSTSTSPNLQGTLGVNANKPVLNAAAFGPVIPYAPGTNGVPPCYTPAGGTPICDNYENGYTEGQRNIFRAPFQSRFDFGIFKDFKITERWTLRYDAQFFNVLNHPTFDIPNNLAEFNPYYSNPPTGYSTSCDPATGAFQCPPSGHLGIIQHTIGSPRVIQMALHLTF